MEFFKTWLRPGTWLLVLCALVAVLFLVAQVVPNIFVLEFLSSFLPQATVVFTLFGLLLLWAVGHFWRHGVRLPAVLVLSLVCVVAAGSLGWVRLYRFAYERNVPQAVPTQVGNLRVVFFNKLYTNQDYGMIDSELYSLHPDIIGFAEITKDDVGQLQAYKNYPYRYITDCYCNYLGAENGFLSKYPIVSTELVSRGEDSGIFLHVVVKKGDQLLDVWVVHPHSPTSQMWTELRSEDLKFLGEQLANDTGHPTFVMGDFNTPPWSSAYEIFTSAMHDRLHNTAQGQGLVFTWGSWLLQTEIDHMFASRDVFVKDFHVLDHFGSDHKMIYADFGL